jgi:O-antigen ligase
MKALIFVIPIYAALFFLYGIRNPKRFLLLTGIISLPLRTDFMFSGVSDHEGWSNGVVVALSDVSFILLFGYLIMTMRGFRRASSTIIVPSIFFIMACVLSTINSVAGILTLYQVVMFSKILLLYYIVAVNAIETEEDLKYVVMFLTISLMFQGALGCAQFATGYELDVFSTGQKVGGLFSRVKDWGTLRRVFGTQLGRPNSYASFLVPLLLFNSAILLGVKQNTKLRWTACVLGFLGLLFSFSRGGWLSCFGGAIAFVVYLVKTRVKLPKVAYFAAVAGLIGLIIFLPLLKTRLTADDNNAAGSRIPLLKLATNMIREYPLIGVGANTFANVIRRHVTADLRGLFLYQVHNQYLLVFAETGVVGLLCFLWLLYSIFKIGLMCIRRKDNNLVHYIGLGGIIGYISSLLHMHVDLYTSRLQIGSLYLICAIFTAGLRLPRIVEEKEGPVEEVEVLV